MQRMKINVDGFDAILMVGVALFAYAAPEAVGGNGYLSAYVVGLILGNTGSYGKKHLFGFFDGFTGLMQMGVFFLLGLLSFPSALVHGASGPSAFRAEGSPISRTGIGSWTAS